MLQLPSPPPNLKSKNCPYNRDRLSVDQTHTLLVADELPSPLLLSRRERDDIVGAAGSLILQA